MFNFTYLSYVIMGNYCNCFGYYLKLTLCIHLLSVIFYIKCSIKESTSNDLILLKINRALVFIEFNSIQLFGGSLKLLGRYCSQTDTQTSL